MWLFIAAGVLLFLFICTTASGVSEDDYMAALVLFVGGVICLFWAFSNRGDDVGIRKDLREQGFTVIAVDSFNKNATVSRKKKTFECQVEETDSGWIITKADKCKEIKDKKKNALKPEGLDGEKK